jgi:DeoR/GlpR family transcriptional regulator of sugar metabolism
MNIRHQHIIQLVSERGSISVSELSQIAGVSEVTIRQDLNVLEKGGFLRRVHGAAVAPESDDVGARMRTRYATKKRLAEHAASLVNAGEVVFIEGGSTNALLARELSERQDITIVTVSHYIATLLRDTGGDVIILGGLYQKSSESVVGPLTRICIQNLNFHKVFIGIDGWGALTGFTGRNMLRCDVVNALMAKQTHTVALTDSSKFGQIHPYPLAPECPFSHVITDSDIPDADREILAAQGLQLDIIDIV